MATANTGSVNQDGDGKQRTKLGRTRIADRQVRCKNSMDRRQVGLPQPRLGPTMEGLNDEIRR